MAWGYLFIAAGFEIAWALGLKHTVGFTRLTPTILTLIAMIASFYFLSQSLKAIPIGMAYAIWTGIGASGVAILSSMLYGEPMNLAKALCILLIISGTFGLKWL